MILWVNVHCDVQKNHVENSCREKNWSSDYESISISPFY